MWSELRNFAVSTNTAAADKTDNAMKHILTLALLLLAVGFAHGQRRQFSVTPTHHGARLLCRPLFEANELARRTTPAQAFPLDYAFLQICLNVNAAESLTEEQLDTLDSRDSLSRSCLKLHIDHQGDVRYVEFSLFPADTLFLSDSILGVIHYAARNMRFRMKGDAQVAADTVSEQSLPHYAVVLPLYVREPFTPADNMARLLREAAIDYFPPVPASSAATSAPPSASSPLR